MLRAAAILMVCLAVSALAVVAARWQWSRHEARSEALAARDTGVALPALDPSLLLSPGDAALPDGLDWRRVALSGHIDASSVTLLRGRSVDGQRADEYLAWLRLDNGEALLVLAGWAPLGQNEQPPLPSDDYRVEGILREQEPDDGRSATSASRITAAQMPGAGGPSLPGYVYATHTCWADADCPEGLRPLPEPELSLGPHLAYSIQWLGLALAAPIIGVWLLRAGGTSDARRTPARRARHARADSDEAIEDALSSP